MKKTIIFLLTYIITIQFAFAVNFDTYIDNLKTNHNKKSIERFLNAQVRYANRNNYKAFLSTYDDKYISYDGFNKENYSALVKSVWDSYKDIEYDINIKSIEINNDIATVDIIETSFAEIKLNKAYRGELKSIANSTYKIQKNEKGRWKIISDKIIDETTTLLYGSAQNLDIKLTTPKTMLPNTDYTASLEFTPPEDTIAVASISADKVEYPQKPTKEVFRTLPDDNILERIFTFNSEQANEYVIATIGLTKADINNEDINLKLTGFGYAIKRINAEIQEITNEQNK